MKTLVCLIAVLLMTAPVLAQTTVTITGEDLGGGKLKLMYEVSGTEQLRGIALNLSCTGNATIDDGTKATVPVDTEFNVFLDYAYDVVTAAGTYNLGDGGPLADKDGPGLPDSPVSEFSVCLGMVDENGLGAGVDPGPAELCTLELNPNGDASTDVTVSADTLRGGAVGSEITIIIDLPGGITITIVFGGDDCPVGGTPEQIAAWNSWGQPANWCDSCWKCGDVNSSGDVTTADYLQVWNDLIGGNTTGRSDVNMSGDLTTADYLLVWNKLTAGLGCTPCE